MSGNELTDPASEFGETVSRIRSESGKRMLSRDELLYLAADEIARSFTFDETHLSNRTNAFK